jgi:hypothetical protein
MNANEDQNASPARHAAEEVLRTIYGDDYRGCTTSVEEIAKIIEACMDPRAAQTRELVNLYERLVAALHLLATPPGNAKEMGPEELRSLLGDRLDAIRDLTTRTIATTSGLQANEK